MQNSVFDSAHFIRADAALLLRLESRAYVSFISAFSQAMERTISSLIPGYASYRVIAEEKIARKTKILPYESAWLRQGDCDQPVFIIDKDNAGNFVFFFPTFRKQAEDECSWLEQKRCE